MSAVTCSSVLLKDDANELAPVTLLASQFFGGGADVHQPEKRLMLAVLENAVWLLLHEPSPDRGRESRRVAEAAEWMASDATDWPFTFVNVCNALALAPEWIRAGLRRHAGRTGAARPGSSSTPHFPFRRVVTGRRRVGARHHG